jgi:hypothetical protein
MRLLEQANSARDTLHEQTSNDHRRVSRALRRSELSRARPASVPERYCGIEDFDFAHETATLSPVRKMTCQNRFSEGVFTRTCTSFGDYRRRAHPPTRTVARGRRDAARPPATRSHRIKFTYDRSLRIRPDFRGTRTRRHSHATTPHLGANLLPPKRLCTARPQIPAPAAHVLITTMEALASQHACSAACVRRILGRSTSPYALSPITSNPLCTVPLSPSTSAVTGTPAHSRPRVHTINSLSPTFLSPLRPQARADRSFAIAHTHENPAVGSSEL